MTGACRCRFCRSTAGEIVLDLGQQPACDHFPWAGDRGPDPSYPLRMWLCTHCGLAQLAEDPTMPDEPRGTEPAALVAQAADAVARVGAVGLLPRGATVAEYGSPHGGSWLKLLAGHGVRPVGRSEAADVLIDCFGLMHEQDQAAALQARVNRLRPGGVLLVQFHSLATILRCGQWNALRHGHYAYYSMPAIVAMLASVGLTPRTVFQFPLYGGTVLLAASRDGQPDAAVEALLDAEHTAGVLEAEVIVDLQAAAEFAAARLSGWLVAQRDAGRRVFGYSAASRAIALLCRAGVTPKLLPAIADAAPAKRGRRMPGSGVPIISPGELAEARPHEVLLFVPDLLAEVRAALPQLEESGGRWVPFEGTAGP
ncbi:MAG: class I SAM-dependent methyltransferase [Pseudonocardiaceae bacterium]